MEPSFGFIGTGNMGGALAVALAKTVSPSAIYLANRTRAKAETLASRIGAKVSDNATIAKSCTYVVLGVKPQMMEETLAELRPILAARTDEFVLVSMAAALSTITIQTYAGGSYPVIRIMPNTPVGVGEGVIMYCYTGNAKPFAPGFASSFSAAGLVDEIDEQYIDAGSVITGCAPAFADMFMEGMAEGAEKIGLPKEKIPQYVAQMLLGSAKLALESGEEFSALRIKVCSPGGSTIEGVKKLQELEFTRVIGEAVSASYHRTLEMKGK
ncbi:MAG TPA: pyrroline-5-carboxylate reductase [Methanocorpusculum sp.]|nr:pyrroline-5-carboxylate reductase [Methanocorpusculum sp.]